MEDVQPHTYQLVHYYSIGGHLELRVALTYISPPEPVQFSQRSS